MEFFFSTDVIDLCANIYLSNKKMYRFDDILQSHVLNYGRQLIDV